MIDFLFTGPPDAALTVVLAHGAGAPMDSPFMAAFAEGIARRGLRCARFEFPYMAQRRTDGKKRPPNPARVLLQTWREAIDELSPASLIIGGKSMGGRIASMLARTLEDEGAPPRGLVCLGYPFHPPGKPEKLRTAHLLNLRTPTLIIQGERDTLGSREDIAEYALSPAIKLKWMADGDHGFKPRKKSGRSEVENWDAALDALAQFALSL
ncbi:alpha/beta fold hydrolase [Varunaivibrio sulfuroxidans]|uniref:KANL3/Tex30 alpha/beta hydrolase-like domain-containing protein n=1 Tax=Varunaivibrio sulfuroxidans TaxID=1773489 RepID=A0A4R3J8V0_9PROT|nr:alpha/beta family hydrolase [Varunaivibrio sulfuroxidans]TCS60970.1 hypothetical protein EDD55_109131 [Varunaivibrio sulfuroxidans]WES31623.1 alpha/beta fold hydrolase [Varunaivibrio sulfuroxidans]